MAKIVEIKISDIKQTVFVRKSLDQERAIFLGELIESGVVLPPIWITKDIELIAGRHRIEGTLLANRDTIQAEIKDVKSRIDMLAMAFMENEGGSLQPTQEDREHTIMQMLEEGANMKQVGELLKLPTSLARKYCNEVKSKSMRAKVQRAKDAVTDGGLSAPQASDKFGVDLEQLKTALGGRKKKKENGLTDVKKLMSNNYHSLSFSNNSLLKKLNLKLEDGDVSPKQVREIFDHIERLHKSAAAKISDKRRRFEATNK